MPAAQDVLERDFSVIREDSDGVIAVLKSIYEDPAAHWTWYEVCEALMDIGNNFQFWRFHHLKTVERIIGHKQGTGGLVRRAVPETRNRPRVLPRADPGPDRDWSAGFPPVRAR